MAINAVFAADFSQFVSAVNQAETKLREFQTGSAQVENALKRVATSFSGKTILSEATLAVKAVNDLGGVTKLTEAEQKKLNVTVTEALAKYKALGQQAPADMVAIAKATRGAGEETAGFLGGLKSVGASILTTAAGFFTAQAAFAAVASVSRAVVGEFTTLITQGPAVADVADNFAHLTEEAGRSGNTLLNTLRAGTHATITDFELMKLASQDLTAGLNLTDQQFGTLAQGAFALAQATGTDVKQGLDVMNDAMLTGRTRSLALLTGKIDLEQAELRYAHALGIARRDLTEEQKLEAARAAILDSVTAATERLGVQTDGLDERIQQVRTAWGNFQDELGRMVAQSPVIETAIRAIADALTSTFGDEQGELVRKVAQAIDEVAIGMVRLAKFAVIGGESVIKEWKDIQIVLKETETVLSLGQIVWLKYQQAAMLASADFSNWNKLQQQINDVNKAIAAQQAEIQRLSDERRGASAGAQAMLDDLDRLIAQMEAARGRAATLAPTLGNAPTGVGGSARAGTAGVGELTDAAAKLKKELEDATATRAYNNYLETLRRNTESLRLRQEEFLATLQQLPPAFEAILEPPLADALWDVEAAVMGVNDAVAALVDTDLVAWVQDSVAGVEGMIVRLEDAKTRTGQWTTELGDLTRAFEQLATIADGSMAGMARSIGAVLASLNLAAKAADTFVLGLADVSNGNLLKGFTSLATGIVSVGAAFLQATAHGNTFSKTLSGAAVGAQFGSAFGPWGTAIGAAVGGLGGLIRGLTGPSEQELEGRRAAAEFRAELAEMLTVAQQAQADALVAEGANRAWAESTIAIRDAYIAAGRSEQEALAIADRLWRAEKEGGAAVQQVIAEIERVLKTGATPALEHMTEVGLTGLGEMTAAGIVFRDTLGRPIVIPIEFDWPEAGSSPGAGIPGFKAPTQADIETFLRNNPGDVHRIREAFSNITDELANAAGIYSYQGGTHGRYVDFGRRRLATLHGRERVVTESEGRAEAAQWDAVVSEVAGLRRDLSKMDLWIRDGLIAARAAA